MKRIFVACLPLILVGCTVGQVSNQVGGYIGLGTGIKNAWTEGGEVWQHYMSTDYNQVRLLAQNYCNTRGFGNPTLTRGPSAGEFSTYIFKCALQNNSDANLSINNLGKSLKHRPSEPKDMEPAIRVISIEEASKKCLDLGFKKGSEELLGCIEKLRQTP